MKELNLSLQNENTIVVLAVALLSLLTSVIVALLGRESEHRLTALEHGVLSKEERDKFLDVCFKMNMLWEFYEKQLPLLLKNPAEMDELLEKASEDATKLSKDERTELIKYLEEKANSDDINRKFMANLYLKVLQSKGVEKTC